VKDFSLFLSGKVEFVSDTECNQSYGINGVSIGLLCAAFNGMPVYTALAFSDEPITRDRMATIAADHANGIVSGEYRTYTHYYSEITSEEYVQESGKIGGHDIHARISSHYSEYACLVLQTGPIDLNVGGN